MKIQTHGKTMKHKIVDATVQENQLLLFVYSFKFLSRTWFEFEITEGTGYILSWRSTSKISARPLISLLFTHKYLSEFGNAQGWTCLKWNPSPGGYSTWLAAGSNSGLFRIWDMAMMRSRSERLVRLQTRLGITSRFHCRPLYSGQIFSLRVSNSEPNQLDFRFISYRDNS